MALRKRNGIWQIDLIHGGKRIRESTGTADEKLAKVMYAEMQSALYRGTFIPSKAGGIGGTYTVAKAFDRAFEGTWLINRKDSTRRSALDQFTQLTKTEWLKADTPVGALDVHALEKLQRNLLDSGLNVATVNRRFWVVRAILTQAKKDGAIASMPDIPLNLTEKPAERRAIEFDEEFKVLAYLSADDRYTDLRDLFVILLDTGARLTEACTLRLANIDFNLGTLRFTNTKNGKPRKVAMSDRVKAVLQRRTAGGTVQPFEVPEGRAPEYWATHLGYDWSTVRGALGLDEVVLHCLRHTAGTRLMADGYDTRTIMEVLGHETPEMTLRYAHGVPERIEAAASSLGSFADRAMARKQAQQS